MERTRHDAPQSVIFGEGNGTPLLLDLYRPNPLPAAPMPAVIWVHGGGWAFGDRRDIPSALVGLTQIGFLVASVEYRLSDVAPFPAQIHDVKAAIRWLRAHAEEQHVDGERIGISGHSAGGHLAALAGTSGDVPHLEGGSGSPGYSSRVEAVVPISPATDLEAGYDLGRMHGVLAPELISLFGGPPLERLDLVRMASPIAYIDDQTPPFLIVHGDADEVIPVSQSDRLDEALRARGRDVTYLRIGGGAHGLDALIESEGNGDAGTRHPANTEARMIAFLTRCLGPTP